MIRQFREENCPFSRDNFSHKSGLKRGLKFKIGSIAVGRTVDSSKKSIACKYAEEIKSN